MLHFVHGSLVKSFVVRTWERSGNYWDISLKQAWGKYYAKKKKRERRKCHGEWTSCGLARSLEKTWIPFLLLDCYNGQSNWRVCNRETFCFVTVIICSNSLIKIPRFFIASLETEEPKHCQLQMWGKQRFHKAKCPTSYCTTQKV